MDCLLERPGKVRTEENVAILLRSRARRYWPRDGVNSRAFRARFPDQKLLLRMARLAAKRIIRHWHPWHMEVTHRNYRLGKEIDWFTPPNGDHEWIESLVRFYHMIDLAAAYRITRKRRFLASFSEYMLSFNRARSMPGRHWKYKLNPAIRIINLIRAYSLLCREEELDARTHLAVHESLLTDIRFLVPTLQEVIGNGAFFVTTALLIAAEFLDDSCDTTSWRAPAEARLFEIIDSEIQDDGIEVEHAPMYQGEVLLTLLDYCIALQANERPIPVKVEEAINGLLGTLTELADPLGLIPPIGDSDRLPVSYLSRLHAAVLDKGSPDSRGRKEDIDANHGETGFHLKVFRETGWVVVRWHWTAEEKGYLLFDCSGKPGPGRGGHSHADDLQFLFHDSQGPVLTDPGRFTYCSEFKAYLPFTRRRIHAKGRFRHLYLLLFPRFMSLTSRDWRSRFMSTLAHNTISMDGANQPGYVRPGDHGAHVRLASASTAGPLALLEGELDSYPALQGEPCTAYRHRRTLIGYHPDLWVVVDQVQSEEPHNWTASFHLGEKYRVSNAKDRLSIQATGRQHRLYFVSQGDVDIGITVEDDWVSPSYNEKRPSKTIRVRIRHESEFNLLSILHTLPHGVSKIHEFEEVTVPGKEGIETTLYSIRLHDKYGDTRMLINPGLQPVTCDGLRFEGLAAIETHQQGQLVALGLLKGRYLHFQDHMLSPDSQGNAFRRYGPAPPGS